MTFWTRAGRSRLVWPEGAGEVRETLSLPACVDVHALQGDRPSFQVAGDKPPQTRSNRDPIDHEKRRPPAGRVEHDGPHHEPEGGIDADGSFEAGTWKPGGELCNGAFAERSPDGCGTEQRQGAQIQGSQDQRRADCDSPPPAAGA